MDATAQKSYRQSLPKAAGGRQASWMLGDVNKPWPAMRNKSASRKVSARERATYQACEEAFASGAIYSWSIDQKTGLWLVQMAEGSAWLELSMAEVAVHLGASSAVVKPAKVKPAKVATPRAVKVLEPVVVEVPEVRPGVRCKACGSFIKVGSDGICEGCHRDAQQVQVPNVVEEVPVSEVQIAGLPAEVEEYLARLVFAEKKAYATELAAALVAGGPVPADPGTEWADKVRVKLARLVRS